MLLICAVIGGIFLGLNFSVMILLPVSLLGCAFFVLDNSIFGHLHVGLARSLFLLFFVQGGYLLGLFGRNAYNQVLARLLAPPQSNRI
jgi:hypothetical protein